MRSDIARLLRKQRALPFIGEFKQLLGSASMWFTLAIFLFSAVAAWNTSTLDAIRGVFPWLTLPIFLGTIVAGIGCTMWLEHKFILPSVMVYWNRMFFDHGNALRVELEGVRKQVHDLEGQLERIEEQLARLEGLLVG